MDRVRRAGLVSMAALALVAGGCGNDVEPETSSSTDAPTTTSSEEPSTETTAADATSTTSEVSGETMEVSGEGYIGGLRFELTGAELTEISTGAPGLLIEADLENLNADADQGFGPQIALEGPDGVSQDGYVNADVVPTGSSGTATFSFGDDAIDSLDGFTLLVGADGQAQVRIPLDGDGETIGWAPIELEPSESELSVAGVDIDIDDLTLRWYDVNFNQVADDEMVLVAEISATNGTEGQTCARDSIKFIGPDDDTTAGDGRGDCEPPGESAKGTLVYATIEQPEAGEWTFQVTSDWGADDEEVTGEVTFELTEEMLSGEMGDDSSDDSASDDSASDDSASDDSGDDESDNSRSDDAHSDDDDSSTTDVTTSSDSEDNDSDDRDSEESTTTTEA